MSKTNEMCDFEKSILLDAKYLLVFTSYYKNLE